jgi:hypothetical protein
MTQPMQVVVGMRVRLRKAHPCGGDEWTVTRAGADVGMACARCGRRVLLEREEFERRVKQVVDGGPDAHMAPPVDDNGPLPDTGMTPQETGE